MSSSRPTAAPRRPGGQATAPDGASDYFGYSVAIGGGTAVVGAYWDDDGGYARLGYASRPRHRGLSGPIDLTLGSTRRRDGPLALPRRGARSAAPVHAPQARYRGALDAASCYVAAAQPLLLPARPSGWTRTRPGVTWLPGAFTGG